jgi:hypothetical protein
VDTWCADRAPADSRGDLTALEVAEKFLPFGVDRDAVFLGRSHGSPSGEKGQVRLDGLVGVDSLVAHGDVDVAVAGDDLGDMRWQPALIASVMNSLRKSWGVNRNGSPVDGSVSPVRTNAAARMSRTTSGLILRRSAPNRRWNSNGDGGSHTHSCQS